MSLVVVPPLGPDLCPDGPGGAGQQAAGDRLRIHSRTVLAVAGEADLATAGQLRDELARARERAGRGALVVDVSDLSACDLYGLDVLQQARCAAGSSGLAFTLCGARPLLTWLDRRFPHRHLAPCA